MKANKGTYVVSSRLNRDIYVVCSAPDPSDASKVILYSLKENKVSTLPEEEFSLHWLQKKDELIAEVKDAKKMRVWVDSIYWQPKSKEYWVKFGDFNGFSKNPNPARFNLPIKLFSELYSLQ